LIDKDAFSKKELVWLHALKLQCAGLWVLPIELFLLPPKTAFRFNLGSASCALLPKRRMMDPTDLAPRHSPTSCRSARTRAF
jgi:hypothetical protein